MYVVRDVFKLKFGKAKEIFSLFKEGMPILTKDGHVPDRILTDFTGEYYTFIMEHSFESLADFDKMMSQSFADPDYENWYKKVIPLVERGYREILKVAELKFK